MIGDDGRFIDVGNGFIEVWWLSSLTPLRKGGNSAQTEPPPYDGVLMVSEIENTIETK
jgi:hypothetical protein